MAFNVALAVFLSSDGGLCVGFSGDRRDVGKIEDIKIPSISSPGEESIGVFKTEVFYE